MTSGDASFDSRIIANRVLDIADANGMSLTIMQLLKLIYIAHGWHLTLTGKPLTRDNPEAWQYGPVYTAVYSAFRNNGIKIGSFRAEDPITGAKDEVKISEESNDIIHQVVISYGKYHAYELSSFTHSEGTPWDITYKKTGNYYGDINNKIIREHFDAIRG